MKSRSLKPYPSIGLILFCLACHWAVIAAEFSVSRGETRLVEGFVVLDARIEYVFSEAALEALDNGVPLTLDVHIKVQKSNAWLWEQRELDRHLRFLIRYHTLAQLYQVVNLDADTQQNFVTREAAITALGEILSVPLMKNADLKPEEDYVVKLRTTLDIEALPLPLRPLAYLSPGWNLASEWRTWRLQR